MRVLVIAVIIILNFILQSTILNYIGFFGVVPNTGLIIIVSLALLGGKRIGGIVGLIIGLLQDIAFSEVIGINGLIYFLTGYGIGSINQSLFKENYLTSFLFTVLATIGFHFSFYLLTYFLGIEVNLTYILKKVLLLEVLYNSILSLVIYKQISKLYYGPTAIFRNQRRR